MITDSHVHTLHFSGDGRMTADEMMKAAVMRGLESIVVTEHYDDDFPHDMEGPMIFDLEDYFSAFSGWSESAPKGLDLRLGIELGYQVHLPLRYAELVTQIPFDSVILSNHLFDGKDPYFFRECYDKSKTSLHEEYIISLAEMVEHSDYFDILGHFDYIVRYSPLADPVMRYRDCPEAFDRLFSALIRGGKSLEINTRTIQKLRRAGVCDTESFPDPEILKRYRELGGYRITLGSDAHESGSIASLFEETTQYLISVGFEYNSSFLRRKEILTPLRTKL